MKYIVGSFIISFGILFVTIVVLSDRLGRSRNC